MGAAPVLLAIGERGRSADACRSRLKGGVDESRIISTKKIMCERVSGSVRKIDLMKSFYEQIKRMGSLPGSGLASPPPMMRAMILYRRKTRLVLRELPVPEPAAGQ